MMSQSSLKFLIFLAISGTSCCAHGSLISQDFAFTEAKLRDCDVETSVDAFTANHSLQNSFGVTSSINARSHVTVLTENLLDEAAASQRLRKEHNYSPWELPIPPLLKPPR